MPLIPPSSFPFQCYGKITEEGIFLEQLETDPAKYLPDPSTAQLSSDAVNIDLNKPMSEVLAALTKHPVKTRLNLTGTLVVARDIAHAKIKVCFIPPYCFNMLVIMKKSIHL